MAGWLSEGSFQRQITSGGPRFQVSKQGFGGTDGFGGTGFGRLVLLRLLSAPDLLGFRHTGRHMHNPNPNPNPNQVDTRRMTTRERSESVNEIRVLSRPSLTLTLALTLTHPPPEPALFRTRASLCRHLPTLTLTTHPHHSPFTLTLHPHPHHSTFTLTLTLTAHRSPLTAHRSPSHFALTTLTPQPSPSPSTLPRHLLPESRHEGRPRRGGAHARGARHPRALTLTPTPTLTLTLTLTLTFTLTLTRCARTRRSPP